MAVTMFSSRVQLGWHLKLLLSFSKIQFCSTIFSPNRTLICSHFTCIALPCFVMCACAFRDVERMVGAINTFALENLASSDFGLDFVARVSDSCSADFLAQ